MTELLHLENYSFTYPQQRRPALSHVTLTVPEGAFMVLCGPSGCGKSTLLRQLKTVLAPHGLREGEITFCGTPLAQIPSRRQAAEIGFVQQSPENQVVTDKVWHELAFGLESLGFDLFCEPKAGMFLWARHPDIQNATELAYQAAEQDILLGPGHLFDPELQPSPWFRFNVAFTDDPRVLSFLSDHRHAG